MKLYKIPLRYSIPGGILIFNLALLTVQLKIERDLSFNQVLNSAKAELREKGILLSMQVESAIRNRNWAEARDAINHLSGFRDISRVLLLDGGGKILISDDFSLEEKRLFETSLHDDLGLNEEQLSPSGNVTVFDATTNLLINSNVVAVNLVNSGFLPQETATLTIVKDLKDELGAFQNQLWARAWTNLFLYLMLSFLLWFFFHRFVLRRIEKIVGGLEGEDQLDEKTCEGNDEISSLAQGFLSIQGQLKEAISRYQSILNASHVAIFEASVTGEFTYVNNAWVRLFGYPGAEAIGNTTRLILERDESIFSAPEGTLTADFKNQTQTRKFRTKSGSIRHCELYLGANANDEETTSIIGVVLDKTNELKTEKELSVIFENSVDMICLATFDGFLKRTNPAWQKQLGWSAEELSATPFIEFIHPEDVDRTREAFNLLKDGNALHGFENRYRTKQGEFRWLAWNTIPIREENLLMGIARDVTENKQLFLKVEAYQRSLQKLTTQLSLVEEKHRREIADNVHDNLSQLLFVAKIKITELQENPNLDNLEAELKIITQHITRALENTRQITSDLSPAILYKLGIIETMHWLADKVETEHGLKVAFRSDFETLEMPDDTLILVYRSIQELIFNIIKHASASEVVIRFQKAPDGMEILVKDDGIGFDVGAFESSSDNHGMGLFAVRERIQNLGGRFFIESGANSGTQVRILLSSLPTTGAPK